MLYQSQEHLQRRIENSTTVNEITGCWNWTKRIQPTGYGSMWAGRTEDGGHVFNSPHRIAYEAFNGPVPEGMEVAHLCHCPSCCNPEHLIATTHTENIQMSVRAGRTPRGEQKPNAKIDDFIVRLLREGELVQLLSLSQIARIFGVSLSTIRAVMLGKTWVHVDSSKA
jgi:hypothetical protein